MTMKQQRIPALILAALLLTALTGCGKAVPDNDALWKAAMTDAVFSEDEEIRDLVELQRMTTGSFGTNPRNRCC